MSELASFVFQVCLPSCLLHLGLLVPFGITALEMGTWQLGPSGRERVKLNLGALPKARDSHTSFCIQGENALFLLFESSIKE